MDIGLELAAINKAKRVARLKKKKSLKDKMLEGETDLRSFCELKETTLMEVVKKACDGKNSKSIWNRIVLPNKMPSISDEVAEAIAKELGIPKGRLMGMIWKGKNIESLKH